MHYSEAVEQPYFLAWVPGLETAPARLVRSKDWCAIVGGPAYVAQHGVVIHYGWVETATNDGSMAWVIGGSLESRRLLERTEGYELWIAPQQLQPDSAWPPA